MVDGNWFAAGEAVAYKDAAALSPRAAAVPHKRRTRRTAGPPGLMFEPGVTYNVDDRGAIITRAGARQAARLAGEAAAQQQAEEEAIAAGTPDEATEALLRGEHEYHISGQILAAEIRARNADAVTAAQEAAARARRNPLSLPRFL